MSLAAVRLSFRPDAVAVLTIDQPESRVNVLTQSLWTELEETVDSLALLTDLRGLVVASAKPGVFIAGADLKLLVNATPNDPAVRTFIEQGLRVLEKLETLPFPTCAAIDGVALGGGLEVALACDYRVVGTNPKVQLGLPEVKLGLIPGWGGTQRLIRLIHPPSAAQMLRSGEPIDATQASEWNLVSGHPTPGDLTESVATFLLSLPPDHWADRRQARRQPVPELAREAMTESPPDGQTAVREVLRVIREGAVLPLVAAIRLETEAFLRLAGSPESKQLIAAFFASRKK
jgi:enoyl-CoA hydratase/carnithine racemase